MDPSIGETAKGLVGGKSSLDGLEAISSDEAADFLTPVDVEELGVGAVSFGSSGMLTSTTGAATGLLL